MIIAILIIIVFVLLGVILSNGKGAFLIAGYNTMVKEEKEKYDTIALCKFMGKMMYAFSFCIALWILGDLLEKSWLFFLGIALFIGITIFLLIYVNTGDRFKRKI